ncbi:Leucine-rich repeat and fibronectin type-III domain-containing protein 5 [Geodia barretti]|uniref:Leucine-rich repeat and fibronectin type-III domain-containing protein 5 n=1 Tax=Geodia barretti TaxID=519541 RepID=A0AA35X9S4_GEOBA|nr:Leucine-rich repeat and fibronectin type-III domain-containing protein 5 [Geodia barretti]
MKPHVPRAFLITIRYHFVLICWIWWSGVYSSELGPEDCGTTVNLTSVNNSIIYVNASLDTVCFECDHTQLFGLIEEVVFRGNDTVVTPSSTLGRVAENYPHNNSDTLIVNDSGSVFSAFSDTHIQCCEVFTNGSWSCSGYILFMVKVGVLHFKVFNPPLIMGITEVTEGSPLHLLCDGSNSDPQPTLQWISPDGNTVNESGELDIVTTTRNMTGIYTCVATLPRSTATMISTVDIKIILPIDCPTLKSTYAIIVNMSSTAVGSTATYQCRDGPTDVYTTQCTSTGVWGSHPLSTLDCTESNGPGQMSTLQPCQVGVIILSFIVLVQTGLLVGALVKIILLTKKGE